MTEPNMSNDKWTPEPWDELSSDMICMFRGEACVYLRVESYKRARLCVNACAGMADPAKEIALLRDQNAVMRNALVQARGALLLDHMVDDDGKPFGTTVVAIEAIDAALATKELTDGA